MKSCKIFSLELKRLPDQNWTSVHINWTVMRSKWRCNEILTFDFLKGFPVGQLIGIWSLFEYLVWIHRAINDFQCCGESILFLTWNLQLSASYLRQVNIYPINYGILMAVGFYAFLPHTTRSWCSTWQGVTVWWIPVYLTARSSCSYCILVFVCMTHNPLDHVE